MHQSSVSIFPSITPAATTAIVTGAYPGRERHRRGVVVRPERREVAYYGDDFWVIEKKGFGAPELNGDPIGLG